MPEGMHLSCNVDISRVVVNYFSNLFSKEDLDARVEEREILDCIAHLVSTEMDETLLHHPTLLSEVEKVVFNMKKGKAPDPNGFRLSSFKNSGK